MSSRKCLRVLLAVGAVVAMASWVSAGNNPNSRPFWGATAGTVGWEYQAGTCPTQGGYSTVSAAVGEMNHLGRTTFSEVHCAGVDGLPLDGLLVFKAANGDEVHASYILGSTRWGEADPPLFIQIEDYAITGGTGRFKNASGTFTLTIYVTPTGDPFEDPTIRWPVEFVTAGTIRY